MGFGTDTDLTYNIVEQLLEGTIDGQSIHAHAVSGGRAGTKTPGVENVFLANNPYLTKVKKKGANPGGPTIMGKYRLYAHENKRRLTGFAWCLIRKPKCLIAMDSPFTGGDQEAAMDVSSRRISRWCNCCTSWSRRVRRPKKPPPTLAVVAVGDLDAVDRRLKALRETA